MVKRSEVHNLLDTGSLTEADIPAVLRSVAPEVTTLRTAAPTRSDPNAVLLDCYDITRLLVRLCALSSSLKTCSSSGKILADVVSRMPCSARCAAMFRDLGGSLAALLRRADDDPAPQNDANLISITDASVGYHGSIGPLSRHATLSIAMMWCSALHAIIIAPVISPDCSRAVFGAGWGRLASEVVACSLSAGNAAPPRCLAVLCALGTSLLERHVISSPQEFGSMLSAMLAYCGGDVLLSSSSRTGEAAGTAAAAAARGAQALGLLLDRAISHPEYRDICTARLFAFFSEFLCPRARREQEGEAETGAGGGVEALALELAPRAAALDPEAFMGSGAFDISLLSPRLHSVLHSAVVKELRHRYESWGSFPLHRMGAGQQLVQELSNHVVRLALDAPASKTDERASKRPRLEPSSGSSSSSTSTSSRYDGERGTGGSGVSAEEAAEIVQLFRREVVAVAAAPSPSASSPGPARMYVDVLTGLAEFYGKINDAFTPHRMYDAINLMGKLGVLLDVATESTEETPPATSHHSSSGSAAKSTYLRLLYDCFAILLRMYFNHAAQDLVSAPRLLGLGFAVAMDCAGSLLPRSAEGKGDESEPSTAFLKTLADCLKFVSPGHIQTAVAQLKGANATDKFVFEAKQRWFSSFAILKIYFRESQKSSSSKCPYFPMLPLLAARFGPEDAPAAHVAALRVLSEGWAAAEPEAALPSDLAASAAWILENIASDLRGLCSKGNRSAVSLLLDAISAFYVDVMGASFRSIPSIFDEQLRDICRRHAISGVYGPEGPASDASSDAFLVHLGKSILVQTLCKRSADEEAEISRWHSTYIFRTRHLLNISYPLINTLTSCLELFPGEASPRAPDALGDLLNPFVAVVRSLVLLSHAHVCDHELASDNRSYEELQDVLSVVLSRLVVLPKLSYMSATNIANVLALALLHEASTDLLRSDASSASSSGGRVLEMASQLLGDAAKEAVGVADEEDYRGGLDERHALLVVLSRAHSLFVRYGACCVPKASVISLERMVHAIALFGGSTWHWGYQVLQDDMKHMATSKLDGVASQGLAHELLTAYPQLAAEYFFKPFLRLPSDRQEDVSGLLTGLSSKEFITPFVAPVLSHAVVSTDSALFRALAKLNQGLVFQQNAGGAYDSTLMSLLEKNPTILLDILMSDAMQRGDEMLVISNALPQKLLELARVFKLSGSFDLRTARPAGGRVLQRILVQSAWDLGAESGPRRSAAVRSLRIVSTMYATQSWTGGSLDDPSEDNPWTNIKDLDGSSIDRSRIRDQKLVRRMGIDSFVADMIPLHFLFIMSNLIQKNWNFQSFRRQSHAVRSISQLVRLSRPDAILQFLPKILVALDAALTSSSYEVKRSGVQLVQELSAKLPVDALVANLPYFVVGLLPLLEAEPGVGRNRALSVQSNIVRELNQHLSVLTLQSHLPPSTANDVPTILGLLIDFVGGVGSDSNYRTAATELAMKVINEMISKCGSSDEALQSIPYFPETESCPPALAECASRRREAMASIQPVDAMRRLCGGLLHDSAQVRLYSLKQMLEMLRSRGKSLLDAVVAGVAGSEGNAAISFTIKELLLVFSRENDEHVRDLCAQCLGEIGAFDPSRVSVRLHSSHSADASSSSQSASGHSLPPWAHSAWSFGLAVLQSHLIPALKAANGAGDVMAQDFSSVAIQEVLQILAGEEVGGASSADSKIMPPKLTKALREAGIFDICDPFWSTRYNLPFTQRDYTPELFMSCDNFPIWISSWCLQLICCSRTPFHPVFRACRGVLRYRPQIGQFLLPYLIVDGVISASATAKGIYDFVVEEIGGILTAITEIQNRGSDGGNGSLLKMWSLEHRQLAVQTIFSLLDRFELWLLVKQSDSAGSKASRDAEVRLERDACDRIVNSFLSDISKEVLGRAALSINAFARSIRYLESGARATREKEIETATSSLRGQSTGLSTAGRRFHDGANGQLPTLSKELVDAISIIFAKLDDNDALSGIEKLRYVYGIPSSPWNRIVELQHSERWLEALSEYATLKSSSTSDDLVRSCAASSVAESPAATQEYYLSPGAPPSSPDANAADPDIDPGVACQAADVKRGKMRCLMQLGHEELVLDSCRSLRELDHASMTELQDLGVEAAWRLQQWDDLDAMASPPRNHQPKPSAAHSLVDPFVVHTGKLLTTIVKRDNENFQTIVHEARMNVSSFLAAASMESYSRCYPGLVRLHILRELEQGLEMAHAATTHSSGAEGNSIHSFIQERIGDGGYRWSQRMSVISSSTKQKDDVLSVRRAVFGLLNDQQSVANLWLQSSKTLRASGRFDSALNSLRKAQLFAVDSEEALLEQCHILRGNGNVRKALLLLEPDEALLNDLKVRANQSPKQPVDFQAMGVVPQQLARRLHLSTQWMVEHKLAHGREILDRLKVILYLNKDWETALFYFAKYNDELFESKLKDLVKRGAAPTDDDKAMYQFAVTALEFYGKAIRIGNEFLMQSMPQFLSVYFSFMALTGPATPSSSSTRGGGGAGAGSMVAQAQKTMGSRASRYAQDISACKWYTCTPQIASRIGHSNPEAIKTVKLLLLKILVDFPEQAIWHVCSLLHSLNSERRATGKVLIREAAVELERRKRHASSTMLQESIVMFSSLVDLAQAQTKDKRIRWSIGADLELRNFLVPSQAALSIAFPENTDGLDNWSYFPSDQARIASFDSVVEVMMTKAKPKKIALTTTTGVTVRFLLKQEKHGDLRKDARLMEFNSVVNRLLKESPDSRKRNLRLRTYCVVCLNEESGLMEWVPDTSCLRALVMESHAGVQDRFPVLDLRKVREVVDDLHNKHCETDIDMLLAEFKRLVSDQYRPCFHRWFLHRFVDPTEWIESRDMFTRSAAVWSTVGHIVGLGDRHGDNILIDTQLGECVHVDFDCLFDKGLKLQRPEIVPFRLSPCMVDAMGLTGYEGVFRHSMEACMRVLRENKELLIGVLKPFIQDPTVAWGRGGRAQQRVDISTTRSAAGGAAALALDSENKDADEALRMITERLNGLYNIYHPKAVKIINSYKSLGRVPPKLGLGASQEDAVPEPLSVEGQVDRLIVEATADINLAQMYHGWMPWS